MDDCVQEAMVKSMQVPSITAVEPIVTEKLTKTEKSLKKSLDNEIQVILTQLQTWPKNHQDKHFEQDLW